MPQPLFFGDAKAQLFGVYHPPAGSPRQRAIVICNPLGQEYMRAHRCLRQIASRLSSDGAHVFRFDYAGTGDSSGALADAGLEDWLKNIDQAIEELQAMSMVRKASLLGLRLGATLAARAAEKRTDIDSLLLWDPVVNGEDYLESLRGVHKDMLADLDRFPVVRTAEECHENEIMGFRLSPQLVSDIRSLSLRSIDAERLRRCYVVESAGRPSGGAAGQLQMKSGERPEYLEVEDDLGWNDAKKIKAALLPNASVGAIAERLVK